MVKHWDMSMKKLMDLCPQAFANFCLPKAVFVKSYSETLKAEEITMDGLLEVDYKGTSLLLHLEFQTYNDAAMSKRLMRYNVLTYLKYGLPVLSSVLYLLEDGNVEPSPLIVAIEGLKGLKGPYEIIHFQFGSFELSKLSSTELMEFDQVGLLPLLPFTQGGDSKEAILYMFQQIEADKERDDAAKQELEKVTYTLARLALSKRNKPLLQWLTERFATMQEILRQEPLYSDILQEGREEGREEERNRMLAIMRSALVRMIMARYPELKEFASEQAAQITIPDMLEELTVRISSSQTQEEVRNYLAHWDGLDANLQ